MGKKIKEYDKDGVPLNCPYTGHKHMYFATLELKAKHIALCHLNKKKKEGK